MAKVQHDSSHMQTLIVVFTVPGEAEQQQLVDHLHDMVADHSQREGFVSNTILASEDGVRVAEYIQWATREHWLAAINSPDGKAHVNDPNLVVDWHTYRVVEDVRSDPANT